ncbi:MAG: hypothetical protein NWR91_04575 [Schleiferiaceae bacterium]|jgi:hypothetical protein|nr:hypothetical protein [Schleiferiaceae bacterium]MDP4742715.1 hypothetical protein [Schleiferiaceae bacterium]
MINDWILSGCDERIALRPETDANQYHLNPTKFEGLLMRGSCTCGTLTPDGLKTAQRFEQEYRPIDDRRWIQEQTARLRALFDGESSTEFDLYYGPSGSDMMYWPLLMQSMLHPGKTITNIVSCPEELGSGSILAAQGKFYASTNQFGAAVPKGGVVEDSLRIEVCFLPAREESGHIADRKQAIRDIIAQRPGQPIIGNLVFGSKSGIKDDLDIIDEFKEGVMWVVDLCQFRNHVGLVQALLSKGVLLMVTGSKFFQAPPFCGALLVPKFWTRMLMDKPADHLSAYSTLFAAADAPDGLPQLQKIWPEFANIGLRLRWEIALDEMEAFLRYSPDETDALIRRWNRVVIGRLALNDRFGMMPDMELTNDSIISFTVSSGGRELGYDELKLLFDSLVLSKLGGFVGFDRVFLGQPVRYGSRSFIRLALGSYSIRKMLGPKGFDPFNDLRLVDLIDEKAMELFGAP